MIQIWGMCHALYSAVVCQTFVHFDLQKIQTFLGLIITKLHLLSLERVLCYMRLVTCQMFAKYGMCVAAFQLVHLIQHSSKSISISAWKHMGDTGKWSRIYASIHVHIHMRRCRCTLTIIWIWISIVIDVEWPTNRASTNDRVMTNLQ